MLLFGVWACFFLCPPRFFSGCVVLGPAASYPDGTVRRFPSHARVEVVLEGEPSFTYRALPEERGVAYLALSGDVGSFFYHTPHNETGFGGARYELQMEDGSVRSIKGPWSSSCSSMNKMFGLDDPLVECVVGYRACYVRKSALDRFEIPLVAHQFSDGTVYFKVV